MNPTDKPLFPPPTTLLPAISGFAGGRAWSGCVITTADCLSPHAALPQTVPSNGRTARHNGFSGTTQEKRYSVFALYGPGVRLEGERRWPGCALLKGISQKVINPSDKISRHSWSTCYGRLQKRAPEGSRFRFPGVGTEAQK